MNRLLDFKEIVDQNLVPPGNVAFVKSTYLVSPDFTAAVMAKKSTAAKGLCEWVINIVTYYDVIQVIEPKRIALKDSIQ